MSALTLDKAVAQAAPILASLQREMGKAVVGQHGLVQRMLVGLLVNGHLLLEGVPGLAKTLTVSTLARVLDLSFRRIQFTPDLLPSDVVGTLVFNPKTGEFDTKLGPVYAHLVLADEINRAPAKVQSALLEAMQERQVSIGGQSYPLPKPFLVMATQNPVEQEGTYPLAEAQLDRFLFKVHVDYPTEAEEMEIMRRMAQTDARAEVKKVLGPDDLLELRRLVDRIHLDERLEHYIVRLVQATRFPAQAGVPQLQAYIQYGASPRASIALHLAARASALLAGRAFVLPDDVKAIAPDVLNHRLVLSFEADADNMTGRAVVAELLNNVAI